VVSDDVRRILFVCAGNYCRSPMAHGLFETRLTRAGIAGGFEVDSAGTHAWLAGQAPDPLARAAVRRLGARIDHLRARRITVADCEWADAILVMDRDNREWMSSAMTVAGDRLRLLGEFDPDGVTADIADPYGGGPDEFTATARVIDRCCSGLLAYLGEGSGDRGGSGHYLAR